MAPISKALPPTGDLASSRIVFSRTESPIMSEIAMRQYYDGQYYYYNGYWTLSPGAIAGIVIGSIVIFLLLLWLLWCLCAFGRTGRRRQYYSRGRQSRSRSRSVRPYYAPAGYYERGHRGRRAHRVHTVDAAVPRPEKVYKEYYRKNGA